MLRNIVLFILINLMSITTAHATDIRVMLASKDCPRKTDVQGNRSLVYVNANRDCRKDVVHPYGLVDERLGVQYHAPGFTQYIYLSKVVTPAAVDPADQGTLCVRLFPDGAVMEIIVPKGSSCTLDWSHYSRRYWNGQACTSPGNYCTGIDTLTPAGRQRAQMSIRAAEEAARLAGE